MTPIMGSPQQDLQNKHKFPKVIGAIDGTHIHIHKPKKHAESYINRNSYYSIQLQVSETWCNQ